MRSTTPRSIPWVWKVSVIWFQLGSVWGAATHQEHQHERHPGDEEEKDRHPGQAGDGTRDPSQHTHGHVPSMASEVAEAFIVKLLTPKRPRKMVGTWAETLTVS